MRGFRVLFVGLGFRVGWTGKVTLDSERCWVTRTVHCCDISTFFYLSKLPSPKNTHGHPLAINIPSSIGGII